MQEKGCLISLTLSYQCRCLLCLFHFPPSSVSLLFFFFFFFSLLYLAGTKKNMVRFIAEKTFCLYFFFFLFLFLSLFSRFSRVISQLIISRRVFVNISIGIQFFFSRFPIFSLRARKSQQYIFIFHQNCCVIVIYFYFNEL